MQYATANWPTAARSVRYSQQQPLVSHNVNFVSCRLKYCIGTSPCVLYVLFISDRDATFPARSVKLLAMFCWHSCFRSRKGTTVNVAPLACLKLVFNVRLEGQHKDKIRTRYLTTVITSSASQGSYAGSRHTVTACELEINRYLCTSAVGGSLQSWVNCSWCINTMCTVLADICVHNRTASY